jgi:biopolymer transport protein ExbD
MAGSVGGGNFGGDDEPIAAINVVPLVDIILVVLIIFMVTAPLVLKPTIDINLPKSSSGDATPATPLNIAVAGDGKLSLNGSPSDLQTITAYVAKIVAEKPETAAILQADKTVTLDKLTEIIDVVKSAGVKRVAFSIEKK